MIETTAYKAEVAKAVNSIPEGCPALKNGFSKNFVAQQVVVGVKIETIYYSGREPKTKTTPILFDCPKEWNASCNIPGCPLKSCQRG